MNKIINKFIVITLIVIYFGCVPEKLTPTEPENTNTTIQSEAKKWIINNAVEIMTTDDTGNYSDLMSLVAMIGNSKIIALGEATYGTHECSAIKLRILDMLVNELDFNVVLFGSNHIESESINNFVHTGDGNVSDLLFFNFWWRVQLKDNNVYLISQETADMINWIYGYNQFVAEESKIDFFGYGVQRPLQAMQEIIEYFESIDSTTASFVKTKYNRFQLFAWKYPIVGNYIMNDCQEGAIAVRDTLENLRNFYIPLSSIEEFENILFLANYVIQSEQILRNDMVDIENQYQFDMIKYIIENSNQNDKFVIWDQNSNIGNYQNKIGGLLKSEYGIDLKTIGFSIYEGYFLASLFDVKDGSYSLPCLLEVPQPPMNSYEEILNSAEIPMFLLDVNSNLAPQGSPATDWLYSSKYFNSIETFYEPGKPEKYFKQIILKDVFDIVVHISETSKSELFIY